MHKYTEKIKKFSPMADVVPLTPEQQKLASDNLRIAYWMSRKYLPPFGMDREDWEAECMMCLARACRWFEPEKGTLSTLVDRLVRLRRSNLNSYRRVKRRRTPVVSLDEERGPGGFSLEETLTAPEDHTEKRVALRDLCDRVMGTMDSRAREIFRMVDEGMTFNQIAIQLGFSRQRVSQIVVQARYRAALLFPGEQVCSLECEVCGKAISNYHERNCAKYCSDCALWTAKNNKSQWHQANRRRQAQ